jgi:hypothetical protein
MFRLFAYTLILAFAVTAVSCRKAGTGGKAKINVHLQDNGNLVPFGVVKVRYGVNSFPGTNGDYDDTDTASHAGLSVFEGLRKGDYYFYSYFTDTSGVREAGAHVTIENRIGEQHIVIDFGEEDPF